MKRNSLNSPLDLLLFDKPDWTGREITDWDQFTREPWTIFRPGSEGEQLAKELYKHRNTTRVIRTGIRKPRPKPKVSVYHPITEEIVTIPRAEQASYFAKGFKSGGRSAMTRLLHYIHNPELKYISEITTLVPTPPGWFEGYPVDHPEEYQMKVFSSIA